MGQAHLLEIWMALRVFVSGAAFCPGDDRHHEHTTLCDTGEYLAFLVSVCAGIEVMFCRVRVRVQRRFYPESTLEACLRSF